MLERMYSTPNVSKIMFSFEGNRCIFTTMKVCAVIIVIFVQLGIILINYKRKDRERGREIGGKKEGIE